MKLFLIISNAQSGRAFLNLGEAFGLSDEMAALSVRYMLPAMRKAIARRSETAEGLIGLLEFLGAWRCDRIMQDVRMFTNPKVEADGRTIVAALFPKSGQIRRLVETRAKVLPVEPERLERMLPFIAVLFIGALEQRTRRPLCAVLHRLSGGPLQPSDLVNPYGSLARHLRRRKSLLGGWRRSGLSALLGGLLPRPENRPASSAA